MCPLCRNLLFDLLHLLTLPCSGDEIEQPLHRDNQLLDRPTNSLTVGLYLLLCFLHSPRSWNVRVSRGCVSGDFHRTYAIAKGFVKSAKVPMLLKSLLASGTTQAFTEGKASDGVDFLRQNRAF